MPFIFGREAKNVEPISMRQPGGLALATENDGGNTILFAGGEKANRLLYPGRIAGGHPSGCFLYIVCQAKRQRQLPVMGRGCSAFLLPMKLVIVSSHPVQFVPFKGMDSVT